MPERQLRIRQAMSDAHKPRPVQQVKDRLWNVVIALSVLMLINGSLTIASWAAANSARDATTQTQEISFKNRGASCTIAKAMGIDPLPDLCIEKEIRPYFNPNQPVAGATKEQADRNLKAYCGLYKALGVADRQPSVCSDIG